MSGSTIFDTARLRAEILREPWYPSDEDMSDRKQEHVKQVLKRELNEMETCLFTSDGDLPSALLQALQSEPRRNAFVIFAQQRLAILDDTPAVCAYLQNLEFPCARCRNHEEYRRPCSYCAVRVEYLADVSDDDACDDDLDSYMAPCENRDCGASTDATIACCAERMGTNRLTDEGEAWLRHVVDQWIVDANNVLY